MDDKDLQRFGLLTGSIFAVLFGLVLPWLSDGSWPIWPWLVAGILWAAGILIPRALDPVHCLWMKAGHLLGWVNTRVILGILFFGIFLSIGIVMKFAGRDPMSRRIDKRTTTYRVQSHFDDIKQMEKPF